jgi:rubrerythrin
VQKKKRETVEDFVGWKSEDGLLEVVDIVGRDIKQKKTLFKVICHKCKEDKELFPEGYFVGIKYNLNKGQKPCGCSKKHNWNEWQFLLLASRAAKDRFIVHGYSEEFHGQRTKVNLECLKDGYKWTANLSNIINHGKGCPKCKARPKITEQEALDKCKAICETEGYEPIGFVDNYKNNSSIFEYKCSIHGKQSVSYNNLAQGRRCIGCWKERQKELSSGFYGYYPEKKDEQDYLYVLDFDGKYIKIGRSFDVDERIKDLKKPKNSRNISSLCIM